MKNSNFSGRRSDKMITKELNVETRHICLQTTEHIFSRLLKSHIKMLALIIIYLQSIQMPAF